MYSTSRSKYSEHSYHYQHKNLQIGHHCNNLQFVLIIQLKYLVNY